MIPLTPRRIKIHYSKFIIHNTNPMSQDHLINLECTICHNLNYQTKKNKKNTQKRLELKKFCKFCKKKTLHKETK